MGFDLHMIAFVIPCEGLSGGLNPSCSFYIGPVTNQYLLGLPGRRCGLFGTAAEEVMFSEDPCKRINISKY